ncbi:hypothetical protein Poli38472_001182 [Pythium oligandrum]|uniref:Protein kintoun n=1 Tax=Pythium oligandrum TaxID=41045 RepID=A0A8K1CUS5_PYTOL|nr:hypothetical protein Poli38472_001182 [Pythium oligandrum]|eukprot:TMW69026.1 hypothetical protein Poli38472_001182 [Pythium oligandrum]
MGLQTTDKTPSVASAARKGDNQHQELSEDELTTLFQEAMKRSSSSPSSAAAASKHGPKITKDEQQKFLQAMQDPEFRSLLNDYMLEISDPENRRETEAYLAQLEQEQRVPENKMLIKPLPGFVVKTKWLETQKVFVNVCSSDKLAPPSSTQVAKSAQTTGGTSWHLPYSVGPERMEADKGGARVITYDVCFHTRTLQFATTQRPFRDMVIGTCLDAVEAQLRQFHREPQGVLSRNHHVLKGVLYKSGDPVTMCLKKEVEKPATITKKGAEETITTSKDEETEAPSPPKEEPLMKEVSTVKTKTTATTPSLKTLSYQLIYRGQFEMMDHMQGHVGDAPPASRRPKELVVEIAFPQHTSAKGIDLDVNDTMVRVTAAEYAPLTITLPFAVVEAQGSAKFDKKARKLVVALPVQPPPRIDKRLVIQEDEGEDEEDEEEAVQEETKMPSVEAKKETTASVTSKPRADDAFAMLRETALMVAQDPLYQRQRQTEAAAPVVQATVPKTHETNEKELTTLESTVKAHVASDALYDDLPPLESCSEDEEDYEDPIQVEAPPSQLPSSESKQLPPRTPAFEVTETTACRSYLVQVAGIDSSRVELTILSSHSFKLRFFTAENELFELNEADIPCEVDTTRFEVDVASENMAVILYKKHKVTPTETTTAVPPPPPVMVHFQNNLLDELD